MKYTFIVRSTLCLLLSALFAFNLSAKTDHQLLTDSCSIESLTAQIQPCINNQFYIDLYFTPQHTGTNGFKVSGNGTDYGTFQYGQAYYTFGPFLGDGATFWEFVITDADSIHCSSFVEVGNINCNPTQDTCQITNLVADPLQCTSDTSMSIFINFEVTDNGNTGFELMANGSFFGVYDYTDLPLTISDFPLSGNGSGYLEVCDREKEDCCNIAQFAEPNCTPSCDLDSLMVQSLDCNADGSYSLEIIVLQGGYNPIDSFEVYSTNTYLGAYAYGQSPINIPSFEGSGEADDQITICHQGDPNCCLTTSFPALICDDNCAIMQVMTTAEACDDGEYYIALDLEYRNPGFLGFQVLGNGTNYGIFHYGDLPVLLGPFLGDSLASKEFIVLDQEDPTCANVTTMEPVTCIVSSLEETAEDAISIYTNANTEVLSVALKMETDKAFRLHLFNHLGQEVKTSLIQGSSTQVDLTNLISGIYVVMIEVNGKMVTKKIYHH